MTNTAPDIWQDVRTRLRTFIKKRVSSDTETDDLLQGVLLRVHRHLAELNDRDHLTSWIYQIARNAIIDHYRSAKRRREIPVGLLTDLDKEFQEPGAATASDIGIELSTCLRPMLSRLSAQYREAITLVELEGLTHQEAATRLGLSLPGMKSRVQRGRQQLRKMLDKCCLIELDSRKGVIHFERRSMDSSC